MTKGVIAGAALLLVTAGLAPAQTTPQAGAGTETQPAAAARPGAVAKPAPAPERLTPADAVPQLPPAAAAPGAPLFAGIRAGGMDWTLGESTLAEVARAFGGKLDQGGPEGAPAAWLCFAGAAGGRPAIFWFIADGATDAQPLTRIAVEPQDERGAGTCPPAPAALDGVEAGIPGPGARLAELRASLGEAKPGPRGHVHYAVGVPDAAGGAKAQTAIYTGAGGRVVGLALGLSAAN
ncbi:hypothetical protein [Amaricoccus sp.]|uniref:hypothetical protein n=1 Tax=Amaricoccus sp. TaxID=1872485 RepID=UPI001B70FD8C|nr:hypothetical protein [Amaricoccus sp.]MBP7002011.1 hypothetical protein [Amaricoccus sp.]